VMATVTEISEKVTTTNDLTHHNSGVQTAIGWVPTKQQPNEGVVRKVNHNLRGSSN
jgi:hypothetical protein